MEIDYREVANGKLNGEKLFVCDYNRPDKNSKPIRFLTPIKVIVQESHTHQHNKPNSLSCFIAVDDNEFIIPLFGENLLPVFIYDNLEECVNKWNQLIEREIESIELRKENVVEVMDLDIQLLKEKFV